MKVLFVKPSKNGRSKDTIPLNFYCFDLASCWKCVDNVRSTISQIQDNSMDEDI